MEKTQVTQEVAQSIELPTPESSTNSCISNEEDSLEDRIQLMLAHNSENNSQNDYLDHEISQVDDNAIDGCYDDDIVKTLNRRGRGKGSAVQFGNFSHRGGVTGRARVRAVASSSPSRTGVLKLFGSKVPLQRNPRNSVPRLPCKKIQLPNSLSTGS